MTDCEIDNMARLISGNPRYDSLDIEIRERFQRVVREASERGANGPKAIVAMAEAGVLPVMIEANARMEKFVEVVSRVHNKMLEIGHGIAVHDMIGALPAIPKKPKKITILGKIIGAIKSIGAKP